MDMQTDCKKYGSQLGNLRFKDTCYTWGQISSKFVNTRCIGYKIEINRFRLIGHHLVLLLRLSWMMLVTQRSRDSGTEWLQPKAFNSISKREMMRSCIVCSFIMKARTYHVNSFPFMVMWIDDLQAVHYYYLYHEGEWDMAYIQWDKLYYRIIPNRSTGCLDKNPGGGYIRFREPGTNATNITYKRNQPSKLGGASIRRGAFIGDNTVST